MKKTLIALAALGAMVGAAHAQSNVTLYGVADVGLIHNDPTVRLGFGGVNFGLSDVADQFSVDSGNVSGSRWGLKGSEDLGGGLMVNFQLEQGFNIDNGAAASTKQFHRQAWLGLSGGWGAVQVGRIYTAYDDVSGANNAMWDSTFSVENNFFWGVYSYSARVDNGFRYNTPSFGGFTAAVSYSLDEVKNVDGNVAALSLSYANGPLAAAFGYQVEGQGAAPDLKYTRLSAAYDFGAVVLKGLYGQAKDGAAKTNEYSFGVDVPMGGALTLSAGYGYSKDNTARGNQKRKGFTLGGMYTLSKRTDVYFGVTDWEGKTSGVKQLDNTKYGLGVRHSF